MLLGGIANAAQLVTATVSYEQLPLERWFDGTVEAVKQATVSAETKGRIADIFFDIGDNVPAGTVILRLVSNEQRESLSQSEAKLAEAQASLDVETKEFGRTAELYKRNIVSKSDWDRASARFNIAKAQVSSAQAALKNAREELSYTEIHAPYGGIVSARHVELGEAVQPGTPLMSGFDPKSMRVLVTLPQEVYQKVRIIKKVQIRSEDGRIITPVKITLYPMADPFTSTVKVRLEVPEMETNLYPGEFVYVGFTVGDIKRLLIPSQSVVYRSEVSGVYVIKDNVPILRQIRLGNQFGDKIEVLAGLKEGEIVALDPVAAGIALHPSGPEKVHD